MNKKIAKRIVSWLIILCLVVPAYCKCTSTDAVAASKTAGEENCDWEIVDAFELHGDYVFSIKYQNKTVKELTREGYKVYYTVTNAGKIVDYGRFKDRMLINNPYKDAEGKMSISFDIWSPEDVFIDRSDFISLPLSYEGTYGYGNSTYNAVNHNWQSFWGATSRMMIEGAYGETWNISDTGFTAFYEMIGGGGVWGCQIFDNTLNISAKYLWNFKATLWSEDIDKWVFICLKNYQDEILYGKWIHLIRGMETVVDEKISIEKNACKLVFAMGGEFGDRENEEEIYALNDTVPNDADSGIGLDAYTTIQVRNVSLTPIKYNTKLSENKTNIIALKTPKLKVSSSKKNKLKVTVTKVKKQTGIQIRYKKSGAKKWNIKEYKTSESITKTFKNLKSKKKYTVQVRAYRIVGKETKYSKWSEKKTVKIK